MSHRPKVGDDLYGWIMSQGKGKEFEASLREILDGFVWECTVWDGLESLMAYCRERQRDKGRQQ